MCTPEERAEALTERPQPLPPSPRLVGGLSAAMLSRNVRRNRGTCHCAMLQFVLRPRTVDSPTRSRLRNVLARLFIRFRFVFRQRGVAKETRIRDGCSDRHLHHEKTVPGGLLTPRFWICAFGTFVVRCPCLAWSAGSSHKLSPLAPSTRRELSSWSWLGRPGLHVTVKPRTDCQSFQTSEVQNCMELDSIRRTFLS